MTRLPRIKGTELIKILKKLGFNIIRVKGSHHFLQHADGRCTVVPVHSGETIGPGLLIINKNPQRLRNIKRKVNQIFIIYKARQPLQLQTCPMSRLDPFF